MPRWPVVLMTLIASSTTLRLVHSQAPAAGAAQNDRGAASTRATRPPLFFREGWQQTPQGGEHAVAGDSIGNPALELKLYVPTGELLLSGSANDENNPIHVWTGLCTSPCALALRDKAHFADLSGLARIRWNTKMSGFHQVHPIVKLASGTWLIGERAAGMTGDWLVSELSYADLRWLKLDIERVVTVGSFVNDVDLTKVDEIGFADLMPSSGHGPGGWADVAQIEVYGKPVARPDAKGAR